MSKIIESFNINLNKGVKMNKFGILGIIILSIFLIELSSDALISNYGHDSNNYKLISAFSQNLDNPYGQDLSMVEEFLFSKTFERENNAERLNRIEVQIFRKNFPTMNISQRMNNVLANYRGEYMGYNTYSSSKNLRNRIIDRFVGQPTGFTPALSNSNFINTFGPSYNRGFYTGNNGWRYQNSYNPTMTGAGIHILD